MATSANLCGECTACCVHLEIDGDIFEGGKKPQHVPCPKLCATGCSIYNDPIKPEACGEFKCIWLRVREAVPEVSIEMRPDRVGMMARYVGGDTIAVEELEAGVMDMDQLTHWQQRLVDLLGGVVQDQNRPVGIVYKKFKEVS